MKTLVVYYTRTKTTDKAAHFIADKLGSDIEEIIDKKDRSGVVGWIISGRDAMKKNLTDVEELEARIEDYDLIVIGTPVWAGTMTPAVRSFIIENKDKFKKLAFFSTQGGANDQQVFADMRELSGIDPIEELKLVTKSVRDDSFRDLVEGFVERLETYGDNKIQSEIKSESQGAQAE